MAHTVLPICINCMHWLSGDVDISVNYNGYRMRHCTRDITEGLKPMQGCEGVDGHAYVWRDEDNFGLLFTTAHMTCDLFEG